LKNHPTMGYEAFIKKPWFPYVFPFFIFLILTWLVRFFPAWSHLLYIIKTIVVGALLLAWRHKYAADINHKLSFNEWLTAFIAGLLVLLIWVVPEGYLPLFGTPSGFNPYAFGLSDQATIGLIAMRIIGAAVVVPIMEELFWRSFFMRYLIDNNFKLVPLGTFSLFSFIGVSLVFGLEHHMVVQGIVAGIIYAVLVIRQKNIKGCIIAHGITNLGLGIYVLLTESWMFW